MATYKDPFAKEITQSQNPINQGGVANQQVNQPVTPPAPIPVLPQPTGRSLISQTPGAGLIQGYDTQNNFSPVYVPKGQYVPGISATPKEMNVNSLNPTSNVKIPGLTETGLNEANGLVAGAKEDIASILTQITPPETAADKKQQSILDEIANLTSEQGNIGTDTLAAEEAAGLPELRKQVASLNGEIQTKLAEYNVLQKENENKPITMASIIGNERAILNAKAADIGLLTARANALNGNLEVAQQNVDRAIGLKYSTIDAKLNTYEAQLKALMPTLNKEEKLQAQAQQTLLERQKQEIADKKQQEKDIQSSMLAYISAGGKDQKVLNQFKNAKTNEEALQILGENRPPDTQVVDLGNRKVLVNSLTGEAIKDLGAVGKAGGGDGSGGGISGTYVAGANPVVDSWAERIQSGQAKITDIPAAQASLRNAVTVALSAMGNTADGKPTVTEMGKAALATAKALKEKLDAGKGTSAIGKSGFLNSFGYGFIPGTDRANFVTDFDSLKSQLSLEAVKFLKGQGQVSDAERALLAQASTKLSRSQSEKEFSATLQGIIDKLSGTPEAQSSDTAPPKGTDGATYGFPGYHSDGTQWVIN